jgi:hypothetical protein
MLGAALLPENFRVLRTMVQRVVTPQSDLSLTGSPAQRHQLHLTLLLAEHLSLGLGVHSG